MRSGETTLYLARDSYTHGLADLIQVLDAERTLTGPLQQPVRPDVLLVVMWRLCKTRWAGDVHVRLDPPPPVTLGGRGDGSLIHSSYTTWWDTTGLGRRDWGFPGK